MAQLPLESPGGLSFSLGSDTSGVKLSTTQGVYTYDAVNGTVNVASIVDALRTVTLTLGAEAANVIPVTVQVVDKSTPVANAAAAVQLECLVLDDLGQADNPFFAASTTGTDNSAVGSGNAKLLVTTDATGLALINVAANTGGGSTARLIVRTLLGAGETADLVYT